MNVLVLCSSPRDYCVKENAPFPCGYERQHDGGHRDPEDACSNCMIASTLLRCSFIEVASSNDVVEEASKLFR